MRFYKNETNRKYELARKCQILVLISEQDNFAVDKQVLTSHYDVRGRPKQK